MKNVIYYFSGTGNNLAIAKRLGEELGNTDIFPITTLLENKKISEEYQRVGFTVPSYFSHIPPIVGKCMSDLLLTKEQKIFTIAGCGGNRGRATEDMRQLIENVGKKVTYEFMLILPGSYILSYNAFPKWYQQITIKYSYRKIKKIVKILKSDSKARNLGKGLFYSPKYEERLQESIREFSEKGKRFEVSEACIECQNCVKVCPVHNIQIVDNKVLFGDKCQQCMACIQWCPAKAIDVNGIAQNRNRYHHSDITYNDMIWFTGNKTNTR